MFVPAAEGDPHGQGRDLHQQEQGPEGQQQQAAEAGQNPPAEAVGMARFPPQRDRPDLRQGNAEIPHRDAAFQGCRWGVRHCRRGGRCGPGFLGPGSELCWCGPLALLGQARSRRHRLALEHQHRPLAPQPDLVAIGQGLAAHQPLPPQVGAIAAAQIAHQPAGTAALKAHLGMAAGEAPLLRQAEAVARIAADREGGLGIELDGHRRRTQPYQARGRAHGPAPRSPSRPWSRPAHQGAGPSRQGVTRPGQSRARAASTSAPSTIASTTNPGMAPSGVVTKAARRA